MWWCVSPVVINYYLSGSGWLQLLVSAVGSKVINYCWWYFIIILSVDDFPLHRRWFAVRCCADSCIATSTLMQWPCMMLCPWLLSCFLFEHTRCSDSPFGGVLGGLQDLFYLLFNFRGPPSKKSPQSQNPTSSPWPICLALITYLSYNTSKRSELWSKTTSATRNSYIASTFARSGIVMGCYYSLIYDHK